MQSTEKRGQQEDFVGEESIALLNDTAVRHAQLVELFTLKQMEAIVTGDQDRKAKLAELQVYYCQEYDVKVLSQITELNRLQEKIWYHIEDEWNKMLAKKPKK